MCTVCVVRPVPLLRYGVVAAIDVPAAALPFHQSADVSANGCVLPSVLTILPPADGVPLFSAPRNASVAPLPETGTAWPPATMLSSWLALGQWNEIPLTVTSCPGRKPAAESACSEKFRPPPSK